MNFDKLQKTGEILDQQVAEGQVTGGAVLVLKDGEEIYRHHVGLADQERQIPIANDTIYRIYSMSKPITAAAVMLLYDQGKLDLYDHVSWYLKGFENPQVYTEEGYVPAKREIKIRDLLDMTAGLCYPGEGRVERKMAEIYDAVGRESEQGAVICTRELMERAAGAPLAFHPGERWMYGISTDVAGALIEAVSGMRFSEFLKKELFDPLEMADTGFFVPKEKQERLSQIYIWSQERKRLEILNWQHLGLRGFFKEPPAFESGGGGMVSTIDDYAHFAAMMMHRGIWKGHRLLSENAIQYMTTNHLDATQIQSYNWENFAGYGYGCFNRVMIDKNLAGGVGNLGEYGWDGWAGTYYSNDPVDKITLLYMVQRVDGVGIRPIRLMKQRIYAAL